MPERNFDTAIWDQKWFKDWSYQQRYLYFYLSTNIHCNQAGAYFLGLETISFETKLPAETVEKTINTCAPFIRWYPEYELVWVTDFIKRQSKSPKFLIAVAKSLKSVNIESIVSSIIKFNQETYGISIPYPYPIDTIPILARALVAGTGTGTGKGDIGKGLEKPEGGVFKLFESEINPLTERDAEKLKDAITEYSADCVIWAIGEARDHKARNWAYINKVLENRKNGVRYERFGADKQDSIRKSVKRQHTVDEYRESLRGTRAIDGETGRQL